MESSEIIYNFRFDTEAQEELAGIKARTSQGPVRLSGRQSHRVYLAPASASFA